MSTCTAREERTGPTLLAAVVVGPDPRQAAQDALRRGRVLGVMPQAGETTDAYRARLDALEQRIDQAPGIGAARFG